MIKIGKSECIICEDNVSLYKDICPQCFIKSLDAKSKIYDIKPNNIYNFILDNQYQINRVSFDFVLAVRELKKKLINLFEKELEFNPVLNARCNLCNSIYSRSKTLKEKPHNLTCSKCKINRKCKSGSKYVFCSNCPLPGHMYQGNNVPCEKFKYIYDIYYSPFVQSILTSLSSENDEIQRILNNKFSEEKNIINIKKSDLRICPFTSYKTALAYEKKKIKNENDRLTTKYNKDTFEQVKCRSKPTTKIHCNDVTCGKHHSEHTKTNKVTGCGRKIHWSNWVKVLPDIYYSIEDVDVNSITKSLISKSLTTNLNIEPYICSICNQERKCLAIRCISCSFNKGYICGQCVIDKIYLKPDSLSITFFSETGKLFNFKKNSLNVFEGHVELENFNNGKKIYLRTYYSKKYGYSLRSDNEIKKSKKTCKFLGSFLKGGLKIPNDYNSVSNNVHKLVFNKNTDNMEFKFKKSKYVSPCIIEETKYHKKSDQLRKFNCIGDEHILEFHGLDKLYELIKGDHPPPKKITKIEENEKSA